MRVRVLGQIELVDDQGGAVPVGGRNPRLVLAILASRAGDTVDADRLVDALWPDEPPRTAVHSLRTYVSRLRRDGGDLLAIGSGGYTLRAQPGAIDVVDFEGLVKRAAETDGAPAVALLDEALALWRGRPFGDLAGEEPVRATVVRLEELHVAALERRALALVAAGRPDDAVAAAGELVAEHPLREGAWVALVEALTAANRTPEALRAYQRAAEALAEAGLEPARRLRAAEAAALAGDPSPAAIDDQVSAAHAAVPSVSRRRPPLPAAPSSIVGRAAELEALERLLQSVRLLTITGPGGVGKTRLALELANRVVERREWDAVFVELARIDDPAAVAVSVVDALGLDLGSGSGSASPADVLARAGDLDLLVVLDNCEHVVGEVAAVVEVLLRGGSNARVLATSRERLGAPGEHVWPLAPLAVEGPDAAARQLFVDRARAVRPQLAGDDADLEAIDRMVRRVDGLPLAIEMAAARAALVPLPDLADHLDRELGPLLARHTGEARHRTLRAVVEWSEALLGDEERELFAELSVFPGGAGVDDIAAVTGRVAPLEALCRLADRSLVVADPSSSRARFGMLSVIREHASFRLAESGRAAGLIRRHAEHVLAATLAAAAQMRTPDERDGVGRIEGLIDDLRSVHSWAREHDLELAVRLSAALHLFSHSSLREEPLGWAAEVAELLDPVGLVEPAIPPLGLSGLGPELGVVLGSAVQREINAGRLGPARSLAERAVAAAGTDPEARALTLSLHADVELFAGDLDRAVALAEEALDASLGSDDRHVRVMAIVNVVLINYYRGASARAAEVLASSRSLDQLSPSAEGWLAYLEGEVVLDRDPGLALAALDRAVALADSVGNRYLGGVARVSAWTLRARAGEPGEALREFPALVAHWRRQQAAKYLLTSLRNLVVLLHRLGAAVETAELIGTVVTDEVAPLYGDEARRIAEARAWVAAELGTRAETHLAAGAARTLDDAALAALAWVDALTASGAVELEG